MNAKLIKNKVKRFLASLHCGSHTVTDSNTCRQCKPLLTIKEDTEEQDQFPNDFSFENTKN